MGKVKTLFVRPEGFAEIVDVESSREAAHIRFGKKKDRVVKGIDGLPIRIEGRGKLRGGDTVHLTAAGLTDTLGWTKLLFDGGPEESSDKTSARGLVNNIVRVAEAMGNMARSPGLKQMAIYWATGIPIGMLIMVFLKLLFPQVITF